MAFCRKCGSEIDDEAVICPKCGVSQTKQFSNEISGSSLNTNGIALLGILFPIIGWIVFFIMIKTKKRLKAKDLFCGNIVGTIIFIILIKAYLAVLY